MEPTHAEAKDTVYRLLGSSNLLTHDESHNEEMAAEGLMGLAEAAQRFDPRRSVSFMTFAYSRVVGRVRDRMRKEKKYRDRMPGIGYCENGDTPGCVGSDHLWSGTSSAAPRPARTLESCLTASQGAILLYQMLSRLNDIERRLVTDHGLRGVCLRELADDMGLTSFQATRTYGRAMQKMRRWLKAEGYGLEDFV